VRIGPLQITLREPVKAAPEPPPGFEERLAAVEDGLEHIADQFEGVLDRINRWSARQAAQKRAQALKSLDEAEESSGPEIVAPDAPQEPVHPDALDPAVRRAKKAALFRRRMAGG
jgi:hypothetical protein